MSTDSEIIAFQEGRIAKLEDSLQFVERWAVHHGTKSHMTAENTLSLIQHYPPISAITKSYADGKIPDTFNPFARITELEAQLEAAKQVANDCRIVADNAIAEAQAALKDAERYQALRRGQKWSVIDGIGDTLRAEGLDEAIDDAAIQAEGKA